MACSVVVSGTLHIYYDSTSLLLDEFTTIRTHDYTHGVQRGGDGDVAFLRECAQLLLAADGALPHVEDLLLRNLRVNPIGRDSTVWSTVSPQPRAGAYDIIRYDTIRYHIIPRGASPHARADAARA